MKLLYWAGGLLVVLLTALSLTINLLDWNQYRDTLATLASEQTGMQVDLAGNVQASLFPRPSLSVQSVRLSPLSGETSDTIATAERIDVRLGLEGIIEGTLAIQSLVLNDISLTLEENETAGWRIKGWPQASEDDSEPLALALDRFEVQGGTINFIPLSSRRYKMEGIELSLDGMFPQGPLAWEGAFFVEGEKVISMGKLTPVLVRDESALQLETVLDGAFMRLNARLADGQLNVGRVQTETPSLKNTALKIARILGQPNLTLPDLPASLDVQLSKKHGVLAIESKNLLLGETLGRLDLMVAEQDDKQHVTGNVSVGVIDLDNWGLFSTQENADKSPDADEVPDPQGRGSQTSGSLTADIDVTIEGVRLQGDLGQRIDGVVVFNEKGLGVSSVQALLPGATGFSFNGFMGVSGGQGKLQLQSGDLSKFAAWLQVDVGAVPAGRLKTASLKSDVTALDGVWKLERIKGLVDTTVFTGTIEGNSGALIPSKIQILADSINLGAYFPSQSAPDDTQGDLRTSLSKLINGQKSHFELQADRLLWEQSSYEDVRITGHLSDELLTLLNVQADHDGGSLLLTDSALELKKGGTLTLNAEMNGWALPLTRQFAPEVVENLHASHFNRVDGTVSLAGPIEDMRVGLDIKSGENTLVLSGSVDVSTESVQKVQLQGSVQHQNLAPLLRTAGLEQAIFVPVNLAITAQKEGEEKPLQFKAGGVAAGGKLQLDLDVKETGYAGRIAFDHPLVADLIQQIDLPGDALQLQQTWHSDTSFTASLNEKTYRLEIHDFRNGGMTIGGTLEATTGQTVSGLLDIKGVNLDAFRAHNVGSSSISSTQKQPVLQAYADRLKAYAGTISLAIDNAVFLGQKIVAPSASLLIGDGMLRVDVGDGASLNDGSLDAKLDADLTETAVPFEAKFSADKLDIAAFMGAQKMGNVISATSNIVLNVKGSAFANMMSISGGGAIMGQAATLNFLSVPSLVAEMNTASSGRGFLKNIGSLLRTGTTPVNTFEAKFVLDDGVMLLEKALSEGTWGNLSLDGQVNLIDRYLSVAGSLNLTSPPDTPTIPVKYTGSFDSPKAEWSSRIFERFVLAGIEQRIRAGLYREMEERGSGEGKENNPGLAVFSRAFGLLDALRKKQSEPKPILQESEPQAAAEQTP